MKECWVGSQGQKWEMTETQYVTVNLDILVEEKQKGNKLREESKKDDL